MEKRRVPRHKTLKGGSILFGVSPLVDCVVRNLSDLGACLELDSTGGIPDAFALIIKPENIKRTCRATWRNDRRIGVEFC